MRTESTYLPSAMERGLDLLLILASRDIKVRYKQSIMGIAWAVALPLSLMLVFTFVFTRAIDASALLSLDVPYALYAYCGLVPWVFFSQSLSGAVQSLVANRNLVTKVCCPREVFPLACIASSFVDCCVAGLVLLGLMAYFAAQGQFELVVTPAWCLLPVILLIQIALTAGLGLLLAMANLFFRDIRQVFTVAIQLWMFVSGVVVPIPSDQSMLARLLALNPMVPLIGAYRDIALFGRMPEPVPLAYVAVCAAVILVIGVWSFRRAAHRFAECI